MKFLRAENQLDPFNRFSRTLTCDRQTQGHSIYRARIASRGKYDAFTARVRGL